MKRLGIGSTLALALFVIGCNSGGSDNTGSTASSGTAASTSGTPAPTTTTTTTGTPAGSTAGPSTTTGGSTASLTYEGNAKAIIDANCAACHGENGKAGLDVRTYASLMKGGKSGPAIKAGDADGSLMMMYVKGTKKPQMPFRRPPLSDADQKTLTDWIQGGAKEK